MGATGTIAAGAAAAMLLVQPGFAANLQRSDVIMGERNSAAFVGLRARLPLGGGRPEHPSLRLQLTSFHDYTDAAGTRVRSHRAPGLELGLNVTGKPIYFVGGTELRTPQERLHASGSTKTWLIAGGVVVGLVLVLAAVASAQPTPGPPDGAFD